MRLPRVKPEHAPFRPEPGIVRIGGRAYGSAAEIPDATGSVWTLLCGMDGTRDADGLVALVQASHPEATAPQVHDAVRALCGAGYVEDAASPAPASLSRREQDRYSRSHRFYSWVDTTPRAGDWYVQERLKASTALVIGMGGTGSVAATALAASGIGQLHCVDPDIVELSNLNRQVLYTEDDIGCPKVDAAVERLSRLNSDVTLSGKRAEVTSAHDIATLATDAGADVLVMAADRPAHIRRLANQAALATGTPWVAHGYHGPDVVVSGYLPGDGPCYLCLHQERALMGAEPGEGIAGTSASVAMAAGLAGNLAAHLAVALLTGVPAGLAGVEYGYSLVDLAANYAIRQPRRDDCPDCGPTP